jgi:hypothetical protein
MIILFSGTNVWSHIFANAESHRLTTSMPFQPYNPESRQVTCETAHHTQSHKKTRPA